MKRNEIAVSASAHLLPENPEKPNDDDELINPIHAQASSVFFKAQMPTLRTCRKKLDR